MTVAPLRIAMFTESYPPIINGVAVATRTLVEGLRGVGHTVDVFAPHHPEQPRFETGTQRLPSVSMPLQGWIPVSLPLTPLSFQRMARSSYDVVHTQHPFQLGRVARALARRQNVPLVATVHTQYEQYVHYWTPWHEPGRWIVRQIVREFCNNCNQVVTVAAGMASLLREYGVTAPIEVIPNDVELGEFLAADGSSVREELGLAPDETLLLSVGRLALEKNLMFLLEAIAPLLRASPAARLVFVGDGTMRPELERRVGQEGVQERVLFTGALEHAATARYYAAADVFVMASITEVNPLTIGESLAAGTPVVAVDSFSAHEAIVEGQDGLIVPHDVEAFRDAVRSLIAQPERCRAMGAAARERARWRSTGNATERTVQLYRRLLAAERRMLSSAAAPDAMEHGFPDQTYARVEEIRSLFEYDEAATRQLLEVVAQLTPEQFTREFGGKATSIRQQFAHLVSVMDRYRARLAQEAVPDVQPEQFSSPVDLLIYETDVRQRMNTFLSGLTDGDLDVMGEQVTRRGTLRASCGEVLRHVVNHSTYHRGQIAMLLKLAGVDFPDTDLILWVSLRNSTD